MDWVTLASHIQTFIAHAASTPETEYHLTRVGCGLAGFAEARIAREFQQAPANVYLIDDAGLRECRACDWWAMCV